jgi:predicted esterase
MQIRWVGAAVVVGLLTVVCAGWALAQDEKPKQDEGPVKSWDLRVCDDANQRYFLVGHHLPDEPGGKKPKKFKVPKGGFKLFVVLPGGGGGEDFHGWVKNIHRNVLDEKWLTAQPVAVKWTEKQFIIWPTAKSGVKGQKFTTEEFVAAVIGDVAKRYKVDKKSVYAMGWSSSGPAVYALALQKTPPVTGSYVAMSVFKPDKLPSLSRAKGRAFFIDHSPDDKTCPFRMAEDARDKLTDKGARVGFVTYKGGHGWKDNPFGRLRKGVAWLEKNRAKPGK